MNEIEQVLDKNSASYRCLSKRGGVYELYHVSTFKGHRKARNGEDHLVTVEVWDAGPNQNNHRYFVEVRDEDAGTTATGNPESTIERALDMTHWAELDAK